MSAGLRLGLVLGVLFGVASAALDASMAGFVIFGASALQGVWITWVVHSRTPFSYLVGASAVAIPAYVVIAGLSLGQPDGVFAVVRTDPWLFGVLLLIPIALFAESRLHPEAWRAWGERVERASVVDMLTGRSIPRLRG